MNSRLIALACLVGTATLSSIACTITSTDTNATAKSDAGGTTTPDTGTQGPSPDGGSQDTGVLLGTGCEGAEIDNHSREKATPYVPGTAVRGCLRGAEQENFYSYTVPATPAKGGYVIVSLTDVGTSGNLKATTQAAANDGELTNSYNGAGGGSVYHYFSAKAGASFRLKIGRFSSSPDATAYTAKVSFTGVPDTNAPNFTRATAAALTTNMAAKSFLFTGYELSSAPPDDAWDSWFKVSLTVGTARVELTDVPPDINGQITLYDNLGSQVENTYDGTPGSSVILEKAIATSGEYYIKIKPFSRPGSLTGDTANVPKFFTQPYSLKAFTK